MVKQNAVAGIHSITLAIVNSDPVGVKLRYSVRATRIERSGLLLRYLLYQAVELAGAGLVDACLFSKPQNPHRLQDPQSAQRIAVSSVFRTLKTHRYMALGAEVINLIGLHLLDDPDEVGAVGKVAVVEHQARIAYMGILVEVVNPAGVEAAGTPLDPMNLVALLKQQLRQVAAVLPRDAGNEGGFGREGEHLGELGDYGLEREATV